MTWIPIAGYEGLYEVNEVGEIQSCRKSHLLRGVPVWRKPKLRKVFTDDDGYRSVVLFKENRPTRFGVHRLVAQAFVPNPDGLPCVNFKDGNPSNTSAGNLTWCSHSHNRDYGNRSRKKNLTNQGTIRQEKPVRWIDVKTGQVLGEYPNIYQAAKESGVPYRTIARQVSEGAKPKKYRFELIE